MAKSYHGTHMITIPGTKRIIEAHIIVTIYPEGWWAQSEEGFNRDAKYGYWVPASQVVLGGMATRPCDCQGEHICTTCYDSVCRDYYSAV